MYNITMWIYIVIGAGVLFFLILCLCLAVANFSFDNFRDKQEEARKFGVQGLTIYDFVENVNEQHLGNALRMARCAEFQDHFSVGIIALSDKTLSSNSLASFSIVAHELGHALQYRDGKLSKHWKNKHKKRILGRFFLPLMLVGLVFAILNLFGILNEIFLYVGLGLLGLALLIFLIAIYSKYLEIRVEKEASKNGIKLLADYFPQKELKICEEFLNSARLTYWGDLFRTMLGWTMLTRKSKMFD